jgi:ubiquinone/menaquinone biosynthesis C-methylase UbiE
MMNIILDQKRRKTEVNEGTADSYALGYSTGELSRLELQGTFVRDLTEDVLRRAGLTRGMRVLDLGCGVGDVSLLAGEIVGPTGAVLGLDRSPEAIATAEKRAVEAGQCYWVRFAATELDHFVAEEPFDAIIGRFVLMYLPDPVAALRRFASHLRPGGVMAFQEMAMPATKSIPEGPLYAKCRRWLLDAFEIAGFEVEMGPRLFSTFLGAGLPSPQMIAASRVEGGPDTIAYDYLAETLRSLLPLMERLGITTSDELEVDTLAERLRNEAVSNSACMMLPPLVGAWTRVPA